MIIDLYHLLHCQRTTRTTTLFRPSRDQQYGNFCGGPAPRRRVLGASRRRPLASNIRGAVTQPTVAETKARLHAASNEQPQEPASASLIKFISRATKTTDLCARFHPPSTEAFPQYFPSYVELQNRVADLTEEKLTLLSHLYAVRVVVMWILEVVVFFFCLRYEQSCER